MHEKFFLSKLFVLAWLKLIVLTLPANQSTNFNTKLLLENWLFFLLEYLEKLGLNKA